MSSAEPDVVAPQDSPRAKRTVSKQPPSRRLEPGDLVCGDCGEGNLPSRRFCSRCGGSLADAVTVRTPWWRKILPRRKPRMAVPETEAMVAATRPQRRQRKRSIWPVIRRTVAILLLVAGIAYAAVPAVREWVNPRALAARDRLERLVFPEYVPVRAVKSTASASDKKHPPSAAVDGYHNTYWLTPINGKRLIVLDFQEPVALSKTLVRGGIVGDLRGSHRPRTLHLVYPNGKTADLVLKDHTDPQEFDLDSGGKVDSVEIYIQDLYENPKTKHVAITEIEFWFEK